MWDTVTQRRGRGDRVPNPLMLRKRVQINIEKGHTDVKGLDDND